jgi:hypothetical protein
MGTRCNREPEGFVLKLVLKNLKPNNCYSSLVCHPKGFGRERGLVLKLVFKKFKTQQLLL